MILGNNVSSRSACEIICPEVKKLREELNKQRERKVLRVI